MTNNPSQSAAARAESQLDALIAKIHSLSGGRTPATVSDLSPPAVPAASSQDIIRQLKGNSATAAGKPLDALDSLKFHSESTQVASPVLRDDLVPYDSVLGIQTGPQPSTSPLRSSSTIPNSSVYPPTSGPLAQIPNFQQSRDEPWRPSEPESLARMGIAESMLEALIFRYMLSVGECEGRAVADQLKLPFRMVEPLLTRLKMDQQVAYRSSTATNDYVYVLTESGRAIARNFVKDCTYYGACPVKLKDYIASVKHQSVEGQHPKREDLHRAFSDLLINPKMLDKLGPAINSGRGMFLFGYPGNGKTSIAERVTSAFGKYIWIPRAVEIDGDIMRIYDPMNHELAMPEVSTGLLDSTGYDKRWVRIKRPTLVAGGELTMEMLEVQCNSHSNISEAPLQLKSNCGTLVIDDFGRQKMSVDQLLNRWIVPLEKRYDFLNMSSGKKIQVPFDQLVIFSTNLEPKDLVDDAFLRRIPYKIEVFNPPEEDFRKLFEIMCKVTKIPYNAEAIDYLIRTHYLAVNRPFRNCQPRDLLLQVRNYCLYNEVPIELKNEYFDYAVDNYFSVM